MRGARLHLGPPCPPRPDPRRSDLPRDAPLARGGPRPSQPSALGRSLTVPTLDGPSRWHFPRGRPTAVAALAAAATAVWAADTLAGLADTGTTLSDGTQLLVGHVAFAAEGPAFTLPLDDGDPPDLAVLAGEYANVLAGPPPGLPPDRALRLSFALRRGSTRCRARGR